MSSPPKPALRLDWCSYEAAKYAVEHWHYSHRMPAGKRTAIGVWEDESFVGVIVYSRGANNHLGSPYALHVTELAELTRVALRGHQSPVSRMVSISLRMLKRQAPGLRLIISFADPLQNHHGGVYQAGNWLYLGRSQAQREVMYQGRIMHKRTAHSLFGSIKGMEPSPVLWKHKYAMPLDAEMRERILPLAKPYPKRVKDSSEPSAFHAEEGGAAPTHTLHNP